MKRILIATALAAVAIWSSGCADTSVPVGQTSASASGSYNGGGIDPITQSAIDDISRRTQEDVQRVSDSVTQQNNLDMMNQANQMTNQATMDASNAAAASAAAAANQ